jgi:hypothetical protein
VAAVINEDKEISKLYTVGGHDAVDHAFGRTFDLRVYWN